MEKLDFVIVVLGEGRLGVEVYFCDGDIRESMGILYFERAKRGFVRKPIGLGGWACVDAKVEGLYTKDGGITPTMLIDECRRRIELGGYSHAT